MLTMCTLVPISFDNIQTMSMLRCCCTINWYKKETECYWIERFFFYTILNEEWSAFILASFFLQYLLLTLSLDYTWKTFFFFVIMENFPFHCSFVSSFILYYIFLPTLSQPPWLSRRYYDYVRLVNFVSSSSTSIHCNDCRNKGSSSFRWVFLLFPLFILPFLSLLLVFPFYVHYYGVFESLYIPYLSEAHFCLTYVLCLCTYWRLHVSRQSTIQSWFDYPPQTSSLVSQCPSSMLFFSKHTR